MPPENVKEQIHLFLKPEAPKPDFIITDQEPLSDLQEVLEHISEVYSLIAREKVQTAKWQMDDKNTYYLEILADGADKNDITTMAAPSGSSSTDEEVVKHLIKSKGKEDIHAVYEKFEMIEDIWENKKASLSIIQISAKAVIDKKVLISVFMSPSIYYTYPYKTFPLLKYHPQIVSQLKNEGGVDKKSVWRSK
ncbi:hypothetical protein BDQ17DRAFT_1329723 [Cyathus striatus]|nr:hypothetical protein BDQ17DRAFT_1329723 [Cyathus striatus]